MKNKNSKLKNKLKQEKNLREYRGTEFSAIFNIHIMRT